VSSPEEAIKRVVAAFERSDWSEIDVRWGDVRVHLVTSVQSSAALPAADQLAQQRRDEPTHEARPEMDAADPPPGAYVVVSPSPGIFWRSPEPGLPPFADIGDSIEAAATVCIVEVMKLMNHVKAGVAGVVVAVYGENGVAVRKGQALFAIAPAGSTS
jgi:biotin carboxyl carrier protein